MRAGFKKHHCAVIGEDVPADEWLKIYPFGKGRIKAMVTGKLTNERISLNHDLLCRRYVTRQKKKCGNMLPEAQGLCSQGDVELTVPRDRNGEYEPQVVKKHQMDISEIEDKIIFLYSQGTSTRDIEKTMNELYGIEVEATRVSKITDKLLPVIREWQNRTLESVYAMVILDAIHYKMREDGIVVKKAVYIAIGTDLEGRKDVLGLWVGANESSKYWLGVLNRLKNRGVQDILIVSVDGLTGFSEAIAEAFPKTEIQRCVIHQIRSSTRYVSYKDIKAVTAALKPIYKAPTEESALASLNDFEKNGARNIL